MALGSFFENSRKVDLFMLAMPLADPCRSVGFISKVRGELVPSLQHRFWIQAQPLLGHQRVDATTAVQAHDAHAQSVL